MYPDASTWSPAFRRALQDAGVGSAGWGFAVPGGAAQLAPVPFGPIDRVSVRFSEDVRVGATTLSVVGSGGTTYTSTEPDFIYDPVTFTATWALARPITADRARLEFDSSRQNGVYDFDGVALDGEWADGADAYP